MRNSLQTPLALAAGIGAIVITVIGGGGTVMPNTADAAGGCATTEDTSVAGQVTVTIAASGADCTWQSPAQPTSALLEAHGAQGGDRHGEGGLGGVSAGRFALEASSTLTIEVGKAGGDGGNVTDPNHACATPGAGGAGGFNTGGTGGVGGTNCMPGQGGAIVVGGGGGGGGTFIWIGAASDANLAVAAGGGGGGSYDNGEPGGATDNLVASGHTGGVGATGISDLPGLGGGGGGGGYLGGLAGGSDAGGHGGSNYVASGGAMTVNNAVLQAGDGKVVITYLTTNVPAFTSPATATATVDTPFEFLIEANGAPAPTFDNGSILPTWLQITTTCDGDTAAPGQAFLCGTPPVGSVDDYTFTITARNLIDNIAHKTPQVFTLHVDKGGTTALLYDPYGWLVDYPAESGDGYYAVYGQPLTITASIINTVSGASPSAVEGTVDFLIWNENAVAPNPKIRSVDASCDNVALTDVTISGSPGPHMGATCTIPGDALPLIGGAHVLEDFTVYHIYVSYSGGADYAGAESKKLNIFIYPDATTTTVTTSLNPSLPDDPPTLTATVTGNAPSTTALTDEGTVTFKNGTAIIEDCQDVPLSGGKATCVPSTDLSTPSSTGYPITATFTSTSRNYKDSSPSQVLTQKVLTGATSTTLSASPASPINISDGEPHTVTYTARVTYKGVGIQAGTVTFTDSITGAPIAMCSGIEVDDSTSSATCSVDYSDTATAATENAGTHPISADYSGSGGLLAASSGAYSMEVVDSATPAITSADNASASIGLPFSFIVTATGSPAASISLADSSNALPGGITLTDNGDGTATLAGKPQPGAAGARTVTFVASNTFDGTTQTDTQEFTLTVVQANTDTTLSGPSSSPIYGEEVTITATVAPPPGSDPATIGEGSVSFSEGRNAIAGCSGASAVTVTSGTAACTVPAGVLAAGDRSFTATYGGTANYRTSTSAPLTMTVGVAVTTTALTVDITSPVYGQTVVFTATVTAESPATALVEGGTVTFSAEGSNTLCTAVPVVGGTASCSVADGAIAAGTHTIEAAYSGTSDFAASANPTFSQTVDPADTTTTVTSSNNPAFAGQSVTLTATLTANAPSTIDPGDDGTVTVTDTTTGATLCTAVPLAGGEAECPTTFTTNGPHEVSAAFSGDANYNPGSGTLAQAIQATTTTSVTAVLYDVAPAPVVSLTASISSPSGLVVDEGTVSFSNGDTLLCTVDVADGEAVCTAPVEASDSGSHTLTAHYNGTDNFLPSSGAADVVAQPTQPTVGTITPGSSDTGDGWVIQGGGFSGTTSVTVCGISVPFTVINDSTVVIDMPSFPGSRQCVVTITAAGGTGSSAGTITVTPPTTPGGPVIVPPTEPGTPSTPTCAEPIRLSGQWTLIAWAGADGVPVAEALTGGDCGDNITSQVSVIWGWEAILQAWHAYFPGITTPGANDLTTLKTGSGYFVALADPSAGAVSWTVNVAS